MEYMCHRWPRICSTCRKHFLVFSSFMAYHLVCSYTNTTDNTSGAGTAYPSGTPEFNPGLSGVRVTRSLALCVWLFVLQYFFFSSLCWLSFELRIMITALVSSNSSYSNLAKGFIEIYMAFHIVLFLLDFASCSSIAPRPPIVVRFLYFILIFWINCPECIQTEGPEWLN